MPFTLDHFVSDFAQGMMLADKKEPCKPPYLPGIGPHTEVETIKLTIDEMACFYPERYGSYRVQVPYLGKKQKCDICFGREDHWEWVVEVKMVRFFRRQWQAS